MFGYQVFHENVAPDRVITSSHNHRVISAELILRPNQLCNIAAPNHSLRNQ